MRELAVEILRRHLELKTMEEDKETWWSIENNADICAQMGYGYYMVVYQNTYFEAVHEMLEDISVVIYSGGTATAIWPLSIYKNSSGYQIGSWGGDLLPPLMCERGNTTESKRKLLRKCIEALQELCERFDIDRYKTVDICFEGGTSLWTQMLFERGAQCCGIDHECYVDLSMEESYILSRMRRTNKYSIQKSEQLWKSEIITNQKERSYVQECFEKFRELHIQVSGRETRSKRTWDIQCEAVLHTNDFVILLHDKEDRLIGASLYSTTGSMGSYSVAAYRRELFDQPIGHMSQWMAIKHMKELGIEWYYVGRRAYPNDWDHPTEKEVSIGHFKEGFATNIYLKMHMEMQRGREK